MRLKPKDPMMRILALLIIFFLVLMLIMHRTNPNYEEGPAWPSSTFVNTNTRMAVTPPYNPNF